MKKYLFAAFMLVAATINAQEASNKEYDPNNYWWIEAQGGVSNVFNGDHNNWPTFMGCYGGAIGHQFDRIIGARLHVNSGQAKGFADYLIGNDFTTYNYKYLATNLDILINLVNAFGKKESYPVNLNLIMGLGGQYIWDNAQAMALQNGLPATTLKNAENKGWAFNTRVGLGLEIPVHKNVAFTLEGDLDYMVPKSSRFNIDRLQFLGLAGIRVKFGYKKKPVIETEEYIAPVAAAVETVAEVAKDTVWYDDITYKESTRDREIKKEIFFGIRESGVETAAAQIKEVAEFLKTVKDGEITITSYSDAGTGNPRINMKYSKLRAEKTKAALIAAGVDPALIKTVEWKGDTVQPYAENEKNRLSVIKGHGVYTAKDKVVTKKFRLQ